ncbi:major facilitator superfamily domain-containing protein [Geopyxis carbonaria]|nr:major facilitator superfamily domain-containing protein [Geopyxis carbonaria]
MESSEATPLLVPIAPPAPAMTSIKKSVSLDERQGETNPAELIREEYLRLPEEERAAIEKKLKRKLDIRLFPCLLVFYILNYIDRNALPAARLLGLEDDLSLSSTEYATCISILYVGYLLMQVPSNLLMTRFRPSLYLSLWMMVWGCVSASCAGVHDFKGLFLVRFFLGFCEAPFFPGAVFLLSAWYTRTELALRTAILYGGSLLSGSFGSLIALGITSDMEGVRGLAAWRWLFIIEGAMTVGFAIIAIFVLPNYPYNTRWLSDKERLVAQGRLLQEQGTSSANETLLAGAAKMIRDPKVYALTLNHFLITLAASFTNFFPTIVGTLGFDTKTTYALLTPPYLLAFISTVLLCHHADKTRERTWHIITGLAIAVAALVLLGATLNTAARYTAMIIMTSAIYVPFDTNLTWISNCIPRTAAKRAASIAFVNMVSNLGNLSGSYLFPTSMGPRYPMACGVQAGSAALAIGVTWAFRTYLKRQNLKMDRGEREEDLEEDFRYVI